MMIPIALDSETYPIRPGRQAPRVVCVQIHDPRRGDLLFDRERGLDDLERLLAEPETLIYGHSLAFDALTSIATRPRLLPLWITAYRADRCTCTYEREKLIRIAMGTLKRYPKNGLTDLIKRYKVASAHAHGDKTSPDAWRTRYHELDGIAPELYPADARRYALADLAVRGVYEAQETCPPAWLADQYRQSRAALGLALHSAWGMRTDLRAVTAFAEQTEIEHEILRELLTRGSPASLERWCEVWTDQHEPPEPMTPAWLAVPYAGGLVRPDGSKDTKAAAARMRAVSRALGLPIQITKTGKSRVAEGLDYAAAGELYTALDADATAGTSDPVLIAYSRYVSISTLRSRCERLRLAAEAGLPIQPRFDCLKETGRTSCSGGSSKPGQEIMAFGDQTQNLPRAPGLRECYTARPGCLILSVDWRAAELHTLAQTCLGLGFDSNLARVLNSGKDVHLWFGALIKGWTYEYAADALVGKLGAASKKEAKSARQAAKAANFGFPGGLGIEKFRLFAAKTYHVRLTDAEARTLKAQWLDAFPEMTGYFAHIHDLIQRGEPLIHPGSGRYRGDIRYTSAANSYFQGRCADMLKDAIWRVVEAVWIGGLPCRPWNEAHDELMIEVPEPVAHEVALEIVRIMEDVGRDWCPGAPVKAEPALQRIWRKGAEPEYQGGRLVPWEDRDLTEDTAEKIRKFLARGRSPIQASWTFGYPEDRIHEVVA